MFFSVNDLILICLVAFLFILIFRIQKRVFPKAYHSVSSFILQDTVTVKLIVIRILLLLTFGATLSKFIETDNLITFGSAVGSFLIIWPAILNYKNDIEALGLLDKKDKILYYVLLILFSISSTILVYTGANLSPFYLGALNNLIENWIFLFLFGSIGVGFEDIGGTYLNKRITLKQKKLSDALNSNIREESEDREQNSYETT